MNQPHLRNEARPEERWMTLPEKLLILLQLGLLVMELGLVLIGIVALADYQTYRVPQIIPDICTITIGVSCVYLAAVALGNSRVGWYATGFHVFLLYQLRPFYSGNGDGVFLVALLQLLLLIISLLTRSNRGQKTKSAPPAS